MPVIRIDDDGILSIREAEDGFQITVSVWPHVRHIRLSSAQASNLCSWLNGKLWNQQESERKQRLAKETPSEAP